MKECKNSDILPCYRDGYGVWCHSDDTHDKVYELNKQMCDLGKTMNNPMKPLSEAAIQEIAKALEITRKPKDIMEEKKTKKMTKAEAFEWLKCKKIDCGNTSSSQVQAKLFEIDMCWITGDKNICVTQFLLIDADGCISHCSYDDEYFNKHHYTQVSADDILSIEIVEEKKPSQEFVPYELTEMGKVQSTLDDGEVLIITRKQILKIQL